MVKVIAFPMMMTVEVNMLERIGAMNQPARIIGLFLNALSIRSLDELIQVTRKRTIAPARQLLQYLLYFYTRMSLASIAVMFKQDHTTVIHSLKCVAEAMDCKDREIWDLVQQVEAAFVVIKPTRKEHKYFRPFNNPESL